MIHLPLEVSQNPRTRRWRIVEADGCVLCEMMHGNRAETVVVARAIEQGFSHALGWS